ncbi:MAG: SPOR domain-containing protein [Cellvibrionaceae bacterium]
MRLDDGLRQRIAGAVVLVALAVIFLPSIFDPEKQHMVDTTTQIPPAPQVLSIVPDPIGEPVIPDAPPAQPVESLYIPDESEAADVAMETALESSRAGSSDSDVPVKQPLLDEKGLPISWVIQVASFDAKDKATELTDRLQQDSYKAYFRRVKSSKGVNYRVYVGPKIEKAVALREQKAIDQKYKVSSLLLRFKA